MRDLKKVDLGFKVVLYVLSSLQLVNGVSHGINLLWTEQGADKAARIMSIPEDPNEWIRNGFNNIVGEASPVDEWAKTKSHRIALGFEYASQELFWSDRGFKEIYRARIEQHETSTAYNVSVHRVFTGISAKVYGMAVDWVSKTIYWTDASYDWITMASTQKYEVFKHIVTTGLDKPMGIAVYPQKGLLYWSDWGAIPKIEVASLLGENRRILYKDSMNKPLGMTVDIDKNLLYWVDDYLETITWIDCLDGTYKGSIVASAGTAPTGLDNLFGIAVYKDVAIVTDQSDKSLKIVNITSSTYLGKLSLTSTPYDVTIYAEDVQRETTSACSNLRCEHICVSQPNGGGTCVCGQGFMLRQDNRTCILDNKFYKPSFLYTIGHSLCNTKIQVADRPGVPVSKDVNCNLKGLSNARALGFHSKADLIFYADQTERAIKRTKLAAGSVPETISVQHGKVTGISVDWISDHLYWTDEEKNAIMVSKLDGTHDKVLLKDISQPKGIAVDPHGGYIFWTSGDGNVYRSWLNGQFQKVIVEADKPDGIVYDSVEKRIYWADGNSIYSCLNDGTDRSTIIRNSSPPKRGITKYREILAYTDGKDKIFFANKTGTTLKGIHHTDTLVSHDVVAYGDYLQPLGEGPCDADNGGCNQLCFRTPPGHSKSSHFCGCSVGFYLSSDKKKCLTKPLDDRFLLFTDQYMHQIFQVGLVVPTLTINAIGISEFSTPSHADYDHTEKKFYWIDSKLNVIKSIGLDGKDETGVVTLPSNAKPMGLMISPDTRQLVYVDAAEDAIFSSSDISKRSSESSGKLKVERVLGEAIAVDTNEGFYFWARTSSGRLKIEKKALGDITASVEVIWEMEIDEPVQTLSTDLWDKRLYWCTSTEITSVNYDGTHPRSIIADRNAKYIGLAISPRYIYISHQDRRQIFKMNKDGRKMINVTDDSFSQVTGLKVFYREDPPATSPGKTNTETSHGDTSKAFSNELIIIVAATISVLVLIVLIIFGILLWRRSTRKRTPPRQNDTTEAHDNPTYMTNPNMPPPQNPTGGAAYEASGVEEAVHHDYETLPEKRDLSLDQDEVKDFVKTPLEGGVSAGDTSVSSSVNMPLPERPRTESESVDDDVFEAPSGREQLVRRQSVKLRINQFDKMTASYNKPK